jgi:hypothetical protein
VTDQISRDVLPIPDRPFEGTLPYDARDTEASFPPIEQLQPPAGAPNVLVILLDDVGFAASSAFGGPCLWRAVHDADGRAAGREWPEVQPLPHDGAVRPDSGCLAVRAQPPLDWHGGDHGARHLGARLQLDSS